MADQTMSVEKRENEASEVAERTRTGRTYLPAVDIYETAEGVVLLADMPGVDENSLDITLEKNILTIEGRVSFTRPEGYDLAYAEYGVGDYYRTFALSDEVDRNRIEASLRNGLLKLTLPKAEAARTRKIQVRAE
jgi:HSP20 family molecular chaperone IbpA